MPHDLVIRGATVLDGSGGPPFAADVAVDDGIIAEVGGGLGPGRRELSAPGAMVTPGFIDGHTHLDAQVLWDPLGTSSCWHGVTTAVMGNCGFSLAPARPDGRALVVRNLERAEDIPASALAAGITWSWDGFAGYLDAVEATAKGINFAAYVGHSALRTWAMGERAFEGPADQADLEAMEAELARALAAGAIGLSSSRSANHETSDDRPVASRLAGWDEVQRLVGVLGASGRGVFELALEPAARAADAEQRDEFLGRLGALALDSGVPVTFGVLGGADDRLLALIEATTAAGGTMFGQSHCRGVAGVLSFRTRLPFDALPGWRALRSAPEAEQLARLADPEVRRALARSAETEPYGRAIGAEARRPDFDRLYVFDRPVGPHRSVAEVAAARGAGPVETMIDLAVETGFGQFFLQPLTPEDPELILPFLRHPGAVMTFSDSGAHVSQVIDSSIQTHLLAYWVRQRGELSWPEAVRMLSSAPADAWGLTDRGRLEVGNVADLNVLDPERVGPCLPEVVDDLPGGTRRLVQRSEGFVATVVGGQVVLEGGEDTGARPGRLLRSGGRHRAV